MSGSYYYAVARTAELENSLLGGARIEQMAQAPDAAAALRVLSGTVYGDEADRLSSPGQFESLITSRVAGMLEYIEEVCPQREIADFFLIGYDVANLKVLLKGEKLGRDFSGLLSQLGILGLRELRSAFSSSDFGLYPPELGKAVASVRSALAAGAEPGVIDLTLDRAQFAIQRAYAAKSRSAFMLGYLRILTDLANLRGYLRVGSGGKAAFYPVYLAGGELGESFFDECFELGPGSLPELLADTSYASLADAAAEFEKEGKPGRLEKECDDLVTEFIRASDRMRFGPEPLVRYIAAVMNETAQIRIIMVGKLNGVPTGEITARLRRQLED